MTTLFAAYFLVSLSVVAYVVRLGFVQRQLKQRIQALDANGCAERTVTATKQRAA